MRLFHRELGSPPNVDAPALVVLHGLYGSSRNWVSVGRRLAERYRVLALDLRNHGQSPHAPGMGYASLAEDVLETLDALVEEGAIAPRPIELMGHSLGGKAAMRFACSWPRRVAHLWVLDIAPRGYQPDRAALDSMIGLELAGVTRRAEAEARLAERIDDRALRQFLLTNLVREGDGFRWQLGLAAIAADFAALGASPLEAQDRFEGKVTFVVSDRSGYFRDDDHALVREHFPTARVEVLAGAGHDVHFEGGDRFVELVVAGSA